MTKTGFIFDLDGVIVDTAKYHYLAWKNRMNFLKASAENAAWKFYWILVRSRRRKSSLTDG